jgi:hypothetical protein
MERMRDYRELPSYFQFPDDFEAFPFHIIQNTVTNLRDISAYEPYIKTPLADLSHPFFKHNLQEGNVYYYYNAHETPGMHPYVLMTSKNAHPLLQIGYQYLVEKNRLEAVGPALESYWEKSKQHGTSWKRKGAGTPLMALYHDVERALFYGLYPFTSV